MQKIEFSYGRDLTKKLRYKNRGYGYKNGDIGIKMGGGSLPKSVKIAS